MFTAVGNENVALFQTLALFIEIIFLLEKANDKNVSRLSFSIMINKL